MNWRGTQNRYGSASIGLHWLMLLLIAAVYACIELRGSFPKGSNIREELKTWHFMFGIVVLALVAVRAVFRLGDRTPPIQPIPPKWQSRLSQLMHYALYGLMVGMPLLGWLTLNAEGKQIPFFGMYLPSITGESKAVAEWCKDVHEAGGAIGYFLIGAHAAAALYHHYFLHDNTLDRMLPVQRRRS